MSRALLVLRSKEDRDLATKWVKSAPPGTRVEFKETKRSIPQNDKLYATLTDVAKQVVWYGQKLTPTDWKDVFTAALVKARIVPNLDGNGFVQLGLHTSDMSKGELSNLLELIHHFGAEHGVIFHDPETKKGTASANADGPEKEARPNAPALAGRPTGARIETTTHTKELIP
jgi:hypothetical protein